MKLTKYAGNPILKANPDCDWENLCVLNPAVYYDEKSDMFYMLYRAAGDCAEHYIYLGLATSKDGEHFVRQSSSPALAPSLDGADGGGVEDPRIVKIGDWYYITYASRPYAPGRYWLDETKPWFDPPYGTASFLQNNDTLTYLAITRDFKSYKKLGRITDSRDDDRDVILFPEKINGKFVRFSRPMNKCGEGFPCKKPSIWISYSSDIMEWENAELFAEGKEWWESAKIGGSCPPIKTNKGWLFIYHGVSEKDSRYRVGAFLLDLENPSKILSRTKDFIMEPEFPYETDGYYTGCVFPTACVVKDDMLYIYYGAADKYVCLAKCSLNDILNELK